MTRLLALAALLLSPAPPAAPPLLVAADLGEPDMMVWWRSGDLLTGNPKAEGRPGLRPLATEGPTVLPDDLSGWTPVGESCTEPPVATGTIDSADVKVTVIADPAAHQIVRLTAGKHILAENTLGRPATVCSVMLAEADALPGPEILVSWRVGEGTDSAIRGLTVFRVPETARY